MSEELYKKYRPKNLLEVVGQSDAVNMLKKMLENKKLPHSILLSGPSGCGKTTIARILKSELQCHDVDYEEINCADIRGIDLVRDIRSRLGLSPMGGPCRIFYIDEAHQLTKEAQNAFLKILEDTPNHIYFMLASTDAGKLVKTIHTRCTELKLKLLSIKSLNEIVCGVCLKENNVPNSEVIVKLVECAEGSARKALVLLHQIVGLEGPESQLEALEGPETHRTAVDLYRSLYDSKSRWQDVCSILKNVDEEPETVRHIVLACATRNLLSGGKLASRAYLIVCAFEGNFYDSKKAGLVRACYEVMNPVGE